MFDEQDREMFREYAKREQEGIERRWSILRAYFAWKRDWGERVSDGLFWGGIAMLYFGLAAALTSRLFGIIPCEK